jgi:hypothetical protein
MSKYITKEFWDIFNIAPSWVSLWCAYKYIYQNNLNSKYWDTYFIDIVENLISIALTNKQDNIFKNIININDGIKLLEEIYIRGINEDKFFLDKIKISFTNIINLFKLNTTINSPILNFNSKNIRPFNKTLNKTFNKTQTTFNKTYTNIPINILEIIVDYNIEPKYNLLSQYENYINDKFIYNLLLYNNNYIILEWLDEKKLIDYNNIDILKNIINNSNGFKLLSKNWGKINNNIKTDIYIDIFNKPEFYDFIDKIWEDISQTNIKEYYKYIAMYADGDFLIKHWEELQQMRKTTSSYNFWFYFAKNYYALDNNIYDNLYDDIYEQNIFILNIDKYINNKMFSYYLSQNENPKVIEILDKNWKKIIKNDDFYKNILMNPNGEFLIDKYWNEFQLNDRFNYLKSSSEIIIYNHINELKNYDKFWINIAYNINSINYFENLENLDTNTTYKTEEFYCALATNKNAIKLIKDNWEILPKTELFWTNLAENENAIELIDDNWTKIIKSYKFKDSLAKNKKALTLILKNFEELFKNGDDIEVLAHREDIIEYDNILTEHDKNELLSKILLI